MKKIISTSLLLFLVKHKPKNKFEIDYEEYQLDNGLTVIHQDDSDPLVAIATVVHVGSNRKTWKNGVCSFFEHVCTLHPKYLMEHIAYSFLRGADKGNGGTSLILRITMVWCLKMPWKNLHG